MAIKTNIYNQKGEQVGQIELSEKVFAVKAVPSLIHQAMVAQLSNARQVLAHTKDRSEVRGGGKKPWSQKGTGRARQGSIRSPQWVGGGVVFGPTKERNFKVALNAKMRVKAICGVLSDKLSSEKLAVMDELKLDGFRTKDVEATVSAFEGKLFAKEGKSKRSFLIVNGAKDEKAKYSARNLAGMKLINIENINVYDLLRYQHLVLTKSAVEKLQTIYAKQA